MIDLNAYAADVDAYRATVLRWSRRGAPDYRTLEQRRCYLMSLLRGRRVQGYILDAPFAGEVGYVTPFSLRTMEMEIDVYLDAPVSVLGWREDVRLTISGTQLASGTVLLLLDA